jgi:hypothetical protein
MYYVPCNSCVSNSYAPQLLCIQAFVCPRSRAIHGLGGWKVSHEKKQASLWTWWQVDTIFDRLFSKLVPNQLWRYGIILGSIEFCHWQMKKKMIWVFELVINFLFVSIGVQILIIDLFSLIFLTFKMQDVNFLVWKQSKLWHYTSLLDWQKQYHIVTLIKYALCFPFQNPRYWWLPRLKSSLMNNTNSFKSHLPNY